MTQDSVNTSGVANTPGLDEYTESVIDLICELIADGMSLRKICATEGMPDKSTVLRWLAKEPVFATKYAHARALQADTLFEDMQDVADTGNPEDTQRARLRVLTMQWRAAKLAPKKYGDKQEVEHTGGVTMMMQPLDDKI